MLIMTTFYHDGIQSNCVIITYHLLCLDLDHVCRCCQFVNAAVNVSSVLTLLPTLLPESGVASRGNGKRRKVWKPSVVESLGYFIDVQKVLLHYF
jgi:hypothetical protein